MQGYFNEIESYNNEFNVKAVEALRIHNAGNTGLAQALVNTEVQAADEGILNVSNKIIEYQEEQLALINEETDSTILTAKTISWIALIVSILIGVALVLYVRKTITAPLKLVVKEANVIASGDLSQQDVVIRSKDEIGQLGQAFNTMKNNLASLIKNVQVNTRAIKCFS